MRDKVQPAGLTERQKRFVHHYIEVGNGSKAARLAGYSPISAKVSASRNITNVNVMEAIKEKTRRIYDEKMLRERLTDVIESPETQTVLVNAIRVGMLERAMLTERSINDNLNRNIELEVSDADKVAIEALKMLEQSEQFVKAVSPQPVEAKEVTAEKGA